MTHPGIARDHFQFGHIPQPLTPIYIVLWGHSHASPELPFRWMAQPLRAPHDLIMLAYDFLTPHFACWGCLISLPPFPSSHPPPFVASLLAAPAPLPSPSPTYTTAQSACSMQSLMTPRLHTTDQSPCSLQSLLTHSNLLYPTAQPPCSLQSLLTHSNPLQPHYTLQEEDAPQLNLHVPAKSHDPPPPIIVMEIARSKVIYWLVGV